MSAAARVRRLSDVANICYAAQIKRLLQPAEKTARSGARTRVSLVWLMLSPAPQQRAASTNDCCCATNKLYPELKVRSAGCVFRLGAQAPPAAAERAAVGDCMTKRSWRGSGGSCAVLAMRNGGGGKNFGCLRPVWGSSAGSLGLSWRFGAESGGEETRRRGAGVMDGLGVF